MATLSDLRAECPTCGVDAHFTGRVVERDGQRSALVRCPDCHVEFPVWRRAAEPLLQAYVAARARLTHADAYDRAWATLRGHDGAAIETLLRNPPAEVPFFRLEDVAVPRVAAMLWCDFVLGHAGFAPSPTEADRVAEALVSSARLGHPAGAVRVAGSLTRWSPEVFREVLLDLPGRVAGGDTAALEPVFRALRAHGGAYAEAAAFVAPRWRGPAFSAALGSVA
ncbi:hypothetical protein LBMAG42_20360 [Deltaproteobacteria bacterium]|nr:hypothetical protein LBMAG42_20360 [Deltaproteobacteria bacterium]